MPQIASLKLLIAGLVLLVIGWTLRQWAGRHDLKDLAVGAAWDAAKARNVEAIKRSDLGQKFGEVVGDGSKAGMAKRAATVGVKSLLAQVVGLVGLIGILAGLALMAAGVFWR